MLLREFLVTVLASLLALNTVSKFASYVWLKHIAHIDSNGLAPWTTATREVFLQFDIWTRYKIHSAHEWAALTPGDGIVHLGTEREPFTVAMLHQLRCINLVRDQLTKSKTARDFEQTRHCMNYLRQMLMCHADQMLDPYQYMHKIRALNAQPVRRCLDWRVVYEQVEENQREYDMWVQAGQNGTRPA